MDDYIQQQTWNEKKNKLCKKTNVSLDELSLFKSSPLLWSIEIFFYENV